METALLVMIALSCLFALASFWCLVNLKVLRKKNNNLHNQLTVTESDLIRVKETLLQFEKKHLKNQEHHSNSHVSHQNELLDLRRDHARLKDEIKKYKEDLRLKDAEFKHLEKLHIDKLFLITHERDTLLNQIKEIDRSYLQKSDELKKEIDAQKSEIIELVELKSHSEKQIKSNISKVITLQGKLKIAEQEIEKLTKERETFKVQPQTSTELARWRERATCAKKMYQLMRQMRELSDNKVQSYQEGVIAISEWVLNQTKTQLPQLYENENKADRFLAEAWAAVIATSYTEITPHFEQIPESRV